MKKFVCFLFAASVFLTTGNAFAEVILEPQWSQICPSGYENVKPSKLSPSKTYWYNRRIEFEKSIARCDKYQGADLKSCYSQVMEAENEKNKIRKDEIAAQQEALQKDKERHDQQYQRQQMYNSINKLIDVMK